jgi:putative membrane-bound dehydrogenase-like protein
MVVHPPLRRMIAAWAVLVLFAIAGVPQSVSFGQVSAEQSARSLEPAVGLDVMLWASEPMLVNPTNIDIDSRGRTWVAEGLNYRLGHGGNQRFHRIEQADQIKILEDTDADGKADRVIVFADRIFPVPMGIAVEEHYDTHGKYQGCRVYIGNSPDLLVLEDTDGDDKADKRYPLLSGFGGIDSDHGLHGMVLALDGKLYFTHGDGCCSVQHDHSERQQNFDVIDRGGRHVWTDQLATTLRVNRDGTQFEIICDRQRNNYETCLNSFGNIFTSDNDDDGNRGCRVIWAMDGGHYGYKTPGSVRHWGEDVPGNVPKLVGTGNGSPCGIMVYEGELLPAEYRGAVLEVDAGTRQVNFLPINRKGAAFRTDHKVFLSGDDPWFRPIDACAAPDGSVFVADWYDAGVGGHAFSDQTTGRIYRVAPKGQKSRKVKFDFATIDGLITALKSPNIAAQDAARRILIERGKEPSVRGKVGELAVHGPDPIYRARALWVWYAIEGDAVALAVLTKAVNQGDPRIREQAVRILGRDCRDNGNVAPPDEPDKTRPHPAERHLSALLPLADDPDPGVRRELILALRNIDDAGRSTELRAALRKLAALWDGQDRWYLEALGLALQKRDGAFLSILFDGTLFGDLNLAKSAADGHVALPPYFPVDRNEAFIAAGVANQQASALSKQLGLAWRIHRREVLPVLERVMPHLRAPELQQAADDVLEHMNDPETGVLVAKMALRTKDPVRKRELLAMLGRRLEAQWKSTPDKALIRQVIDHALNDPETRRQGIALAAATGDNRFRPGLESLARDLSASEEVRVASIEALGSFRETPSGLFDQFIASVRNKPSSNPVAEAAVRTIARIRNAQDEMTGLLVAHDYPLGLRREALRTLMQIGDGGPRLLKLVRAGKLPDDLRNDASTLLHTSPVRRVRDEATMILPLPKMAGGKPLPPFGELIRRDGDADKGRQIFFRSGTSSCSRCHRVQGHGQWVGPDLSTIGVKYGRDELVRSILSPSAAVGSSFRSLVVELFDGRVITGLPVEDTSDHLVIKTAEGQRVALEPRSVENRRTSDVSLMPEGLAQTMTDEELVDLLSYLTTLKQPVSIVGEYHVVGPLHETGPSPLIDPASKLDLGAPITDSKGRQLFWRRAIASAEGQVDLAPLVAGDPKQASYLVTPVVSPIKQQAQLVLDTPAEVLVWLNGRPVALSPKAPNKNEPWTSTVELAQGSSTLMIRLVSVAARLDTQPALVTTFVVDRPVGFDVLGSGLAVPAAVGR